MTIFNGKIFSGTFQLIQKKGKDANALYVWMLSHVHEQSGHFNGYVVNVNTGEKIYTFQSSTIE